MEQYGISMAEVICGKGVIIFPGTVIGRPPIAPIGKTEIDYSKLPNLPVYIGDNTIIGANTVIYNNVKIGNNCLIGDGVYIREGAIIGDNCIIGISCKVGARTIIGEHTRVMDLSNVASDAKIGKHVFIGPGVIMGNDNNMGRNSSGDGHSYRGPIVDDWATIGMNATVLPGKYVGIDAIVSAGSVVVKDVENRAVVKGVPAKLYRRLTKEEQRCDI